MTGTPGPGGAPAPAPVTVAIPSLNQGRFIGSALASVFGQGLEVAVNLMDAGSTDGTLQAVEPWRPRLARLRSAPDGGQAQAINEGLAGARSPYVAWLNADDVYQPGGLRALVAALEASPDAAFAYGDVDLIDEDDRPCGSYRVEPWSRDRFARRCFVAQPATLIRRAHWEAVGGLDASLHMALDYDLWWRLSALGAPVYVDAPVAVTRVHAVTKTMQRPADHYREAMAVVRRHYGRVPLWWWLKMPASIGARALLGRQIGYRRAGAR
jgi:glycosyltransferase involved in cell wall biosynthesis